MGSKAHQVDGQGFHVDFHFARGLRRIDVEDDAFFTAQRADGRNVLDDANFVIHEHDADQDSVFANRRFENVHVDQTVGLHVEVSHLKALALEFTHGVQHRFVLGFDGDEVLASGLVEMRRAFDGEVVGLGRAGGPNDFAGVSSDQGGDVSTGFFYRFFCFPTPCMATRGRIAKVLAQPGNHGVDHAGVDRIGRCVVEVNREMWGHVHGFGRQF